ncbi:MAG: M28 family peptidase [Gaiellaceae bacterium]
MKASRRPKPPRARPRPGSLERPINTRIYRGAWVFVVLPLLIASCSVSRQQPLAATVVRPTFFAPAATQTLTDLATNYADRSPDAPNSATLLHWISGEFGALGLGAKIDRFKASIPGRGEVSLANVSATVTGRSQTEIVVIAHRDNSGQGPGGGADDNASGTAVMLELARAYQNLNGGSSALEPAHTIVFLSTDGGAFGAIGATHYAQLPSTQKHVAAVVVLDSVAGPGPVRVLLNGDAPRSPAPVIVATVFQLLSEQPGAVVTHASSFDQLLDLAFPFSLYEQAPFIARGIPAVTITTAIDRPPSPLEDTIASISPGSAAAAHLALIGRATEQILAALDQGAPEPHTVSASYVYLGGRFIHGWALQFVLLAALLPALLVILDLFARCRRRQIALRPAFRSLGRRLGFWCSLLVFFLLFSYFGFWPNGTARPLSPDTTAATSLPYGALVFFLLLAFGAWLITRDRLLPKHAVTAEDELAGYTAALLLLAGVALLTAVLNSYSLLFLLPPLHAWIWLPQLRSLRPWARLLVLLAGFLGPLLVFWELASRLRLGFKVVWYVSELAAVGYISVLSLIVGTAFTAATAQLSALSVNRYGPYPARGERPQQSLPQNVARHAVSLSRWLTETRRERRKHAT